MIQHNEATMRCDENSCPIAGNMDLSRSTPEEKKATAHALYTRGWTMERIAEKLGVSTDTISRWLVNFPTIGKLKPAKTASNPKGAGRPKGSKKNPKSAESERAASLVLDKGRTQQQAASEAGVNRTTVRIAQAREEGRREAEPDIDPATLEIPAKKKLEIAKRQMERRLQTEFESRVSAEVERRTAVAFPHLKEAQKTADAIMSSYRPRFTKAECNDVARVLHPDTWSALHVSPELQGRLTKAFVLFSKMQDVLCIERSRASA